MEHRTALITGAGSGMGQAIAEDLARAGLRVALVGRDRAKLEAVQKGLGEAGSACRIEPCDVADRSSVAGMVERVLDDFGGIDILVCNAGINIPNRSLEVLDPEDWDRLIATNLTGAYNLVHFVLPSMRRHRRGLIIQICSISGIRASVLGGTAYSASKFGQNALAWCIAQEEGKHGIRSTAIHPGEVETPILDRRPVPVGAERRAQILQPDDVARAVRFLAELHPRAHVPELIIKPTVDQFA
ncbi:SDR family oxidoreductase [Tautonia marina]|uniref:SDR family oxidoreductase n=1 Tax=Tautonia marina TaxID=2653855 RepID=UPI001F25875A|nr:SDR family NAD(P)-dependent oxidoreductase [Tautonia marina]